MPEIKGTIDAGICGFITEVVGRTEDGQHVTLSITSDCENIRQLAALLPELDVFSEIGAGYDGELLTLVRERVQGCCTGCVVPAGLFKAMQIAAGLALPQTATMEFEKVKT